MEIIKHPELFLAIHFGGILSRFPNEKHYPSNVC